MVMFWWIKMPTRHHQRFIYYSVPPPIFCKIWKARNNKNLKSLAMSNSDVIQKVIKMGFSLPSTFTFHGNSASLDSHYIH